MSANKQIEEAIAAAASGQTEGRQARQKKAVERLAVVETKKEFKIVPVRTSAL